MKKQSTPIAIAISLLAIGMTASAHDVADAGGKLGDVNFKVECNAIAQREFNLAAAYYHSFAWDHIKPPLERALAADSKCGMVHWMRALAMLDNPFAWPGNVSAKTLAEGAALMEQARATGLKTQRER